MRGISFSARESPSFHGEDVNQRRTSRDTEYVDMVMVQGGITVDGQRLLAGQGTQSVEE